MVASKDELKQQVNVDYQALLTITVHGVQFSLLDPFGLRDGWLSESQGIQKWPSCTYTNISDYLVEHDQRALLSRLVNDYKKGEFQLDA